MSDWKQKQNFEMKLLNGETLHLEYEGHRWVARCGVSWDAPGGRTFSSRTHYEYSGEAGSALRALREDMIAQGKALIATAELLPAQAPSLGRAPGKETG